MVAEAGDETEHVEAGLHVPPDKDPFGSTQDEAPPRHYTPAPGHSLCFEPGGMRGKLQSSASLALLGVKRNLEAGEIVGQIAAVLRDRGVEPPLQRVNIVFMGMGEPFFKLRQLHKGRSICWWLAWGFQGRG